MDPKKKRVLESQLSDVQKRELDLSRKLATIPDAEGRREFVLRELDGQVLERAIDLAVENFDDETQSFDFTFSSEFPVDRWWGREVLIHTADAADLSRMNDGGAFCIDHNEYSGHIGAHEKAWIDVQQRVGRGRARLSKNNPRAVQEYLDIKDGIRTKISTRYRILDLVIYQFEDKPDEYHITKWEVLENSTVAIPADPTVGVGRDFDLSTAPEEDPAKEETRMKDHPKNENQETGHDVEVIRDEARAEGEAKGREAGKKDAEAHIRKMLDVGKRFDQLERAREYIDQGRSYEELVNDCIEAMRQAPPPSENDVDLTDKEASRFSFQKLIEADGLQSSAAREAAAFEYEVCNALVEQDKSGRIGKRGRPIPMSVMRAQLVSDGATGGLLGKNTQAMSMIEELFNADKFLQMGAQPFGDLVGTFDIPVDKGHIDAESLLEDENAPEGTTEFGLLSASPKTVGASAYYPRSWSKQITMDIEIFLRRKLAIAHSQKKNLLAGFGTGGRSQPIGLFNWPGISVVEIDANGGAPTRDILVLMEEKPDVANALMGNLAFLTNAKVKSKLRRTLEHQTGGAGYVWGKGEVGDPTVGELLGYPAHVSNAVPSNLVKGSSGAVCSGIAFGDWSQLAQLSWGPIEIVVDPYTASRKGGTWIHTFSEFDSIVMRAASFALVKDAKTN